MVLFYLLFFGVDIMIQNGIFYITVELYNAVSFMTFI